MATFGEAGNPAAAPRKLVVAEALRQLGGSPARYHVKVGPAGYRTYVEAYVPVQPGSAETVLVRRPGVVSRELTESEESAGGAFLSEVRDLFGLRVDDEEELRAKVVDQKEMGELRYEWTMTVEVEELWRF